MNDNKEETTNNTHSFGEEHQKRSKARLSKKKKMAIAIPDSSRI
jgi:hypothetical protein